MREIKFRAWQRKKMYYFSFKDIVHNMGVEYGLPDSLKPLWNEEKFELMQYTGLKDKNGKEIYEGDVLRWMDWRLEGEEDFDKYVISFTAPSFVWNCYRYDKILNPKDELIKDANEFEVIGNIYENPELLK